MTTWVRLYVTVEGPTERRFVEDSLKPHLARFLIDVRTRVVFSNRKLGARGGIVDFKTINKDLNHLMRSDQSNDARFTTMIDLYALPQEFPGWEDARKKHNPTERVSVLEKALQLEMKDERFLPYIQLHEFEALLYCDLAELEKRIEGSSRGIKVLEEEIRGLQPEDINERPDTAPSKRIIKHIPIYESSKIRAGALAAVAIGLPKLRAMCPHFGWWINQLESLGR